jgi:hypothetical protein
VACAVAASPSTKRCAPNAMQVPLLHAVQLAVIQQPLGPGQPAASTGQLAPAQQNEGQPERTPDGPLRAAQPQLLIGRLPGEHSCVSLVRAVLDRASRGWRASP